ncbi:hypothetical protein PEDI_28260 [Persicobacter diffluens]|uniref:GrpB family protein n=2 Tax=Persicobacter diffluens TaxID=981 RepID=A0AAN5AKM1_9BACT|nr:hypothetical protein PEDI_28260 [Persicobacter diffluens]
MLVKVVPHEDHWASDFEEMVGLLHEKIGEGIVNIHHIGSTSVPGLVAKPVIDIMLEVSSLEVIDQQNAAFEALGFVARGENGISRRRYFEKGGYHRSHQIHAFPAGDEHVERHLAFRDYLRTFPKVRDAYGALKIKVAKSCQNDIEKYCDGKDAFIQHHEALALEWNKKHNID